MQMQSSEKTIIEPRFSRDRVFWNGRSNRQDHHHTGLWLGNASSKEGDLPDCRDSSLRCNAPSMMSTINSTKRTAR